MCGAAASWLPSGAGTGAICGRDASWATGSQIGAGIQVMAREDHACSFGSVSESSSFGLFGGPVRRVAGRVAAARLA